MNCTMMHGSTNVKCIILFYGTRLNVIPFTSIIKYGFTQSPFLRNAQTLKGFADTAYHPKLDKECGKNG